MNSSSLKLFPDKGERTQFDELEHYEIICLWRLIVKEPHGGSLGFKGQVAGTVFRDQRWNTVPSLMIPCKKSHRQASRQASSSMFFFSQSKFNALAAGQKLAGSPLYSTPKTALPA